MVFRTEKRLYQLEKELKKYDFVKVNRNCLVNIHELVHIKTLSNSRLEAELTNGEKIIYAGRHNISYYDPGFLFLF